MNYCGNITKSVMLWEIFVDLLMMTSVNTGQSKKAILLILKIDAGADEKTRSHVWV